MQIGPPGRIGADVDAGAILPLVCENRACKTHHGVESACCDLRHSRSIVKSEICC